MTLFCTCGDAGEYVCGGNTHTCGDAVEYVCAGNIQTSCVVATSRQIVCRVLMEQPRTFSWGLLLRHTKGAGLTRVKGFRARTLKMIEMLLKQHVSMCACVSASVVFMCVHLCNSRRTTVSLCCQKTMYAVDAMGRNFVCICVRHSMHACGSVSCCMRAGDRV